MKHPNLEQLIGTKVRIETREGAVQVGKVSKINYIEVELLGEVVKSPQSIEFHNDPTEFSDWNRIERITKA